MEKIVTLPPNTDFDKLMKRFILLILCCLCLCIDKGYAQYIDGTTGLLHMPTADMQRDKTLMLGAGYLRKEATPSKWYYDTWNYYLNVTFFPWLEVSYTCVLFTAKSLGLEPYGYSGYTNQDRHFSARLRLWKEGWWKPWTPQIVVGVNDFTSGSGGDYTNFGVDGDGNGYFNRYYLAATKHLDFLNWGKVGVHAAYVYNKRNVDKLNAIALGADYAVPLPVNRHKLLKLLHEVKVMAEYDSKGINIGGNLSIWEDHFNVMMELYRCKYPSVGINFKVHLK